MRWASMPVLRILVNSSIVITTSMLMIPGRTTSRATTTTRTNKATTTTACVKTEKQAERSLTVCVLLCNSTCNACNSNGWPADRLDKKTCNSYSCMAAQLTPPCLRNLSLTHHCLSLCSLTHHWPAICTTDQLLQQPF